MKLRTLIDVSIFNEECDSSFEIFLNDTPIEIVGIPKNFNKDVKVDKELDFNYYGEHVVKFRWSGDNDCANKYFNLHKVVINDQKIPAHTIKVLPFENDYINELQKSKQGKDWLKYRKLFPGYRHGWYGDYEISFEFGDNQHFQKSSTNSVHFAMGIKKERVYVDKKHQRRYHLKNDQ